MHRFPVILQPLAGAVPSFIDQVLSLSAYHALKPLLHSRLDYE